MVPMLSAAWQTLHTLKEKPYWEHSRSYVANQRANFATTAGDNGSRATAGGSQRWKLCMLRWEPLESYRESKEGLYCCCAVGHHSESPKLSPLCAKHNGNMQISTANDDVEFQALPQKKAAWVIEACWVWCDSLEWACWLTLACASTGVTS